jgi:hypothetical protein
MKRIIFIVEGDTEKEFIDKVLSPYLNSKGIFEINCFKIKHSRGGLTKYPHLRTDIVKCIFETNVIVTTMIDYYALPKDFPKYDESKSIVNIDERITFLEQSILNDIIEYKGQNFNNLIPYIQLHEFEALVFASHNKIKYLYTKSEANFDEIEQIINQYPNPEDINDSSETAPSKRLKQLIKGYNKIVDGIIIIEENGVENILHQCPRFRKWVELLILKSKH